MKEFFSLGIFFSLRGTLISQDNNNKRIYKYYFLFVYLVVFFKDTHVMIGKMM